MRTNLSVFGEWGTNYQTKGHILTVIQGSLNEKKKKDKEKHHIPARGKRMPTAIKLQLLSRPWLSLRSLEPYLIRRDWERV